MKLFTLECKRPLYWNAHDQKWKQVAHNSTEEFIPCKLLHFVFLMCRYLAIYLITFSPHTQKFFAYTTAALPHYGMRKLARSSTSSHEGSEKKPVYDAILNYEYEWIFLWRTYRSYKTSNIWSSFGVRVSNLCSAVLILVFIFMDLFYYLKWPIWLAWKAAAQNTQL